MKGLIAGLAALLVLGLAFFLYSSPTAPSAEMTQAEIAQIEAEVLQVAQTFLDGFNELDMAKANETMHPDHMTFSYQGRIMNKADYREFLDGWVTNKESWQGHWLETNVRVLSPQAAVFVGTYTVDLMEYSDQPGRRYPQSAWTMLFEKTSDGWKWSMGGSSNSGYEAVEEG